MMHQRLSHTEKIHIFIRIRNILNMIICTNIRNLLFILICTYYRLSQIRIRKTNCNN